MNVVESSIDEELPQSNYDKKKMSKKKKGVTSEINHQ